MQESVMMENPTVCDEHGWHEGNICYRCRYEALQCDHDRTVEELFDNKKRNDTLREVADRYCKDAQELKDCLEESNALHLSTVRFISKMEKESDELKQRIGNIAILFATARCLIADAQKFLPMLEPAKDNMGPEDEQEFINLMKRIKLFEDEVKR